MQINNILLRKQVSDKLSIRHQVFQMIQNHFTMIDGYISGNNKFDVIDYSISRDNYSSSDSFEYSLICKYISSKTYELKDLIKTSISINKLGMSISYRFAERYCRSNDETTDEVNVYIPFNGMDYEEEIFVKEIKARLLALIESNNEVLKEGEES